MTSPDPWFVSARQLAQDIAQRKISSAELVSGFLDRIRTTGARLHAFVEVYDQDAMLAAEAADKAIRSGHAVGPLHGVPIALKDLIDIEGRITTGGSAVWRDRRADRTATLARRLMAQGLIVIGKTHTDEFAMGGWGTNTHMGTPRNPWDMKVARTPGGSSSGSGVAVAAGLVPWAIGTDTGGSVRLPASWCGLTGLKTTIGRVSTDGILPLSPTLDTPGPMTRSVDDAALLYGAMQGTDALDARSTGLSWNDPWPDLRRGVAGLRLGRIPAAERDAVGGDVLAAYDASLDVLARLGAEIVPLVMPRGFAELGQLTGKIMAAEGYAILSALIDDESLRLDPDVRPRLAAGRQITAKDYLDVLRTRDALKREFASVFSSCDAVLTPTTTTAALPLDEVDQATGPGHFTRWVNFLELCALALPNGRADNGLPTSLQIVCDHANEAMALRIGSAFQSATDWHNRHPMEI
jgi:aspartyl-tRNA(Asn)/glutamyl-tRNA(Gln) amidotransferase subunit A